MIDEALRKSKIFSFKKDIKIPLHLNSPTDERLINLNI